MYWLDLVLGVALFKAVLRVALGSVTTAESGCRCISNYICWVNGHNDWKYSCIYRLLDGRFLKFSKVAKLQSDSVQTNKDSSAKMANFADICLVRESLWLHHTIQIKGHWDYVTLCQHFISNRTNHKQRKNLANHKTLDIHACLCDPVGFKHDIVH